MKTRSLVRLLPLLALGLAAGCSDLGVGSGDEVDGLTILDGGGSVLVTVNASGTVSGSLSVPAEGQRSLRVVLRSGSGEVTPGLGEFIRVSVTNPGVALWAETDDGRGNLQGVSSGSTSMRIDLISAGTAIYTSPSISVQVT